MPQTNIKFENYTKEDLYKLCEDICKHENNNNIEYVIFGSNRYTINNYTYWIQITKHSASFYKGSTTVENNKNLQSQDDDFFLHTGDKKFITKLIKLVKSHKSKHYYKWK